MAAEDVAELREDVFHRESAEPAAESSGAARRAAHARMAELVVAGALVGVRQHVVGFGRFLELLLGLFVARVLVGMVLDGRLAVGFLYLVGVGVLRDAKYFVVVSFFCHGAILLQPPLQNAVPCRPACSPSAPRLSRGLSSPRPPQSAPRPPLLRRRIPCRAPLSRSPLSGAGLR